MLRYKYPKGTLQWCFRCKIERPFFEEEGRLEDAEGHSLHPIQPLISHSFFLDSHTGLVYTPPMRAMSKGERWDRLVPKF